MSDRFHRNAHLLNTHKITSKLEEELGEEQVTFAHGCIAEWEALPPRTKTLNGELRDAFCSWYPDMTETIENLPLVS